jgi:hypothetical protein
MLIRSLQWSCWSVQDRAKSDFAGENELAVPAKSQTRRASASVTYRVIQDIVQFTDP